MFNQNIPPRLRYAIIFFGVCLIISGLFIIVSGLLSISTFFTKGHENTHSAVIDATRQCQEDLQTQITQLQDFMSAKKAAEAAGATDASKAALDEKAKAIQSFKSRC